MGSVLFIRHAQSIANAGFRTGHPADIPLSDCGSKQAILIAGFVTHPPTLVVTSSFLRTKQTAEPLLRRYPKTTTEEWRVEEFTYLDLRNCGPMTFAERKPLVEEYWSKGDPHYRHGEGSESFASFIMRIKSVLDCVKRLDLESLVIFTHGHVIKSIAWLQHSLPDVIGAPEMNLFDKFRHTLKVPNVSVLRAQVDSNHRLRVERTISFEHIPSILVT
jgi:probable phosphoglycerate mutase